MQFKYAEGRKAALTLNKSVKDETGSTLNVVPSKFPVVNGNVQPGSSSVKSYSSSSSSSSRNNGNSSGNSGNSSNSGNGSNTSSSNKYLSNEDERMGEGINGGTDATAVKEIKRKRYYMISYCHLQRHLVSQ